MFKFPLPAAVLFSAALAAFPLRAEEQKHDTPKPEEKKDAAEKKDDKKDEKPKEQKPKESKGTVTIAGTGIAYAAKTGTLPLLKNDGTVRAEIFYVYYARTGQDGKPLAAADNSRPIIFCFNGGPGSSAVWLHFGGLGPKKISLPPDGRTPEVLGKITDNPNSLLDVADLVFIDPVGTGASRPAKGEKGEQFWGVDEDVEACGEFIRLFATREQRWQSPKYLCGESYGGIRGAGLAEYLQEKHGMYLNGFIVISGLLNFQTLRADTANDLPFICYLPTEAATAAFHGKLAPELSANPGKTLAEVRTFAFGEYATALLKGRTLPADERKRIAEKLARYTGLPLQTVEDADLRISPSAFRKALLKKEGKIIGRFDARVVAEDSDPSDPNPEFDPSHAFIAGPFSAAANAYVRGVLGYETDQPYRILAAGLPWNYRSFSNRYASMEPRLASAMKQNPNLRVLVCQGMRDLAVPPDAMRFSLEHMPIPDSLRKNITIATFDSGHMMYLLDKDAAKLRADITGWLK
ncbi:MAG: peptidase S10 [Chthoniobacteraceae bacterium]